MQKTWKRNDKNICTIRDIYRQRNRPLGKPFKQKILLLILTCALAYPVLMYLPDAEGAKNNPLMATLILAGLVLFTAVFTHLLKFHPNKEIKLKFWQKTEKE